MDLSIPPFPGLGIRVDTYEVLNVDSVVIGDRGFDVTCIVQPDGGEALSASRLQSLGFETGGYP